MFNVKIRIKELEKELDWFKLEALRLDELCKKYTKQLEHWKIKADALGDDVGFLEDQIKNAKVIFAFLFSKQKLFYTCVCYDKKWWC